ncbi:hypothetical protein FB446DRAFT_729834 [Lentinula raphanica]|nr:hypothetical protein FB446DRAFT_729834 [Lentinula raphanica]
MGIQNQMLLKWNSLLFSSFSLLNIHTVCAYVSMDHRPQIHVLFPLTGVHCTHIHLSRMFLMFLYPLMNLCPLHQHLNIQCSPMATHVRCK